jgi:hypothetical protein
MPPATGKQSQNRSRGVSHEQSRNPRQGYGTELRKAWATSVVRIKCSNNRPACEEKREENIDSPRSALPGQW